MKDLPERSKPEEAYSKYSAEDVSYEKKIPRVYEGLGYLGYEALLSAWDWVFREEIVVKVIYEVEEDKCQEYVEDLLLNHGILV